jgi:hypothetical protein
MKLTILFSLTLAGGWGFGQSLPNTVPVPQTASNASPANYANLRTGAVGRTVSSRLADVVSVKDFGAKGDGSTDDTTAIQAAFTGACTAPPAAVYFPAGQYNFSSQLTTGCAIKIFGDGGWASILYMTTGKNNQRGIVTNFSTTFKDIAVDRASFSGLLQSPAVIRCDNTSGNCPSGPATEQVFIFDGYWSSGWNFGIDISGRNGDNVAHVSVSNCKISVVGVADAVAEAVNIRSANDVSVTNSTLTGSLGNDHIIYLIGVRKVFINGNDIESNIASDSAVKVVGGGGAGAFYSDWTISNNTIMNVGSAMAIWQTDSGRSPSVHILGNTIINSFDTYAPNGGTINFYTGGTPEFTAIFIAHNFVSNTAMGVVNLVGAPGAIFRYVSILDNNFYSWSTSSSGKFYGVAGSGGGRFYHLTIHALVTDGGGTGRAAIQAGVFTTLAVTDVEERNITNAGARYPKWYFVGDDDSIATLAVMSGKLGVGTTTPAARAEVHSAGPTDIPVQIYGAAGQTGALLDLIDSSGHHDWVVDAKGNQTNQTGTYEIFSATGAMNAATTTGLYDNHSVRFNNTAHTVVGSAKLSGGTADVIFSGAWSPFTASSSYFCVANDTTGIRPVQVVMVSASRITLNGTGADVISYACFGN